MSCWLNMSCSSCTWPLLIFHLAFPLLQIDLGVVILSTVVLVAESMNARFLKALRVLRAIKPLR